MTAHALEKTLPPEPGLVAPAPRVMTLVAAYLQVLAHKRPVSHLAGWVSTPIWQTLPRETKTQSITLTPMKLLSLSAPTIGVFEAVVLVRE